MSDSKRIRISASVQAEAKPTRKNNHFNDTESNPGLTAVASPGAAVLRMQQSHGNAAVRRAISQRRVQAGAVQRFEAFEHRQLGDNEKNAADRKYMKLPNYDRDLPMHKEPVEKWPADWQTFYQSVDADQKRALTQGLSYGEVVAMSGDWYGTLEDLKKAPLKEMIRMVPFTHREAKTDEMEAATGGRYLALAKKNERHFSISSTGANNLNTWRAHHIKAIQAAMTGQMNEAYVTNAFADHFLTDAFSAGHMRINRTELMGGNIDNARSKIWHDSDNKNGLKVNNKRGDGPWMAYGDEHLNDIEDAMNRKLATEAVGLSKKDLTDAQSQGSAYKIPGRFDVEDLIPFPVEDSDPAKMGALDKAKQLGKDFIQTGSTAKAELGGQVTSMFTGDTQIRQWIKDNDATALQVQPTEQKIRMINRLMDGYVSNDDMEAIRSILKAAQVAGDFTAVKNAVEPTATRLGFRQRTQLRVMLTGAL